MRVENFHLLKLNEIFIVDNFFISTFSLLALRGLRSKACSLEKVPKRNGVVVRQNFYPEIMAVAVVLANVRNTSICYSTSRRICSAVTRKCLR